MIDPTWCSIPFLMATSGEGGHKLNITRIVEAIIIAGILGAMMMWGGQKVIETELRHVNTKIDQLYEQVQGMRKDLYQPKPIGATNELTAKSRN